MHEYETVYGGEQWCITHDSAAPCPVACICGERGYCADVLGDPLACPVCVELGEDDECRAAAISGRDR